MPYDLAGCCSLVRIVSLRFAVLSGRIQAKADEDHRLIPSPQTSEGPIHIGRSCRPLAMLSSLETLVMR
jgi:hypothetical protein